MRLFVAVNPPPPAKLELADAAAPLRELPGAGGLRWTEPAGWHLTLAFLGEVPADEVPALEHALARVAGGHPAHRLRLAGGGTFGERALWAGVEGDVRELRELAAAVQHELGATDEERGFHPHLTLARAGTTRRRGAGGPADLRTMAGALRGFRGTEWPAGRIQLMRSETGYGPARYTALEGWPLGT
ncbi:MULTISPECIES: RNA 2',3'-cyclic phosphodiesterase [Kitasatospora]|uniref:RNA 2',3'-cyclic phosphodiesterase n=1 Tax=Kitasatospora setae (strain ATCC 33774 / DSM 43861 / JCM 3304 / KCC A-0304 / NBRC 14216 / KM-6054) TaxID=452652 RepID=E4NFF8_KITSK|nr:MULTISPECIES: RNA 2',3'-cyclic phosphodiesterase [Kitasatospora]BAJ30238.1 putative 2'-5' RNA ligase [Kitasatospora setae KM-6054]